MAQGTALYNKFCTSCHGVDGAGDGVAAGVTVPPPRDFTSQDWQNGATSDRIANVIERGGEAMGLSSFMPRWRGILTQDDIAALTTKVKSFGVAQGRKITVPKTFDGPTIYAQYCAGCHGGSGRGDGVKAAAFELRPRDFTDKKWQSATKDEDIRRIIRLGGAATGKSDCMPPWGSTFDRQIEGIVKTVRTFGR